MGAATEQMQARKVTADDWSGGPCRRPAESGCEAPGVADKQGIASAGSVAVALFVDAAAERILKLAGFVDQLVELFPVPVIDHVVTHPGGKHVGVAEGSLVCDA